MSSSSRPAWLWWMFAGTIVLSAFLLFLVQPLIAKILLPWFGGSTGVWATCVVFFQVMLVFGYAYAHVLTSRLTPRQQMLTHLTVLGLAALRRRRRRRRGTTAAGRRTAGRQGGEQRKGEQNAAQGPSQGRHLHLLVDRDG